MDDTHPDDMVQMNVRVPRAMRDAIDARRLRLTIGNGTRPPSRDAWVRHALEWALAQPLGTPVHTSRP